MRYFKRFGCCGFVPATDKKNPAGIKIAAQRIKLANQSIPSMRFTSSLISFAKQSKCTQPSKHERGGYSAAASCPQAPSISLPRVSRKVVGIPASSSV